jgi:DNA-binding beta-propeller fold protein YncE
MLHSPPHRRAARPRARLFVTLVIASATAVPLAAQSTRFYQLETATALKGAAPSWDYLALDTVRGRLFIGRRQRGVTVFDLVQRKVIGDIANSTGANATALVPDADRGYTTNEDGSTTVFRLSTLETIQRIKFGEDADAAVYESVTGQVAFTMGDSKAITFMDARSGAVTGKLAMPSAKLDGAVSDGEASIFVAQRDRNSLARVDARKRRLTAEWKVTGCEEPTGLAFDRARARLFVGCRGAHPVLAVVDARTGRVVAVQPIGRGNDGVAYDATARQVITSNGVDGNVVIYDQADADRYTLAEATTTRPYARTMAFDPSTGKLYLVTAEGTVDPSKRVNAKVAPFYPNRYFDDTFTLLTYSRR